MPGDYQSILPCVMWLAAEQHWRTNGLLPPVRWAASETEIINTGSNLKKLMDLSGEWIDKVQQRKPPKQLIFDLDSSVSETYGEQEGTAYNGHFECTCYHPLFLFNQSGWASPNL